MRKPTTLVLWRIVDGEGDYSFFRTRREAKASLANMVREAETYGEYCPHWVAGQEPVRHEVQLWEGRSLMDALLEGIRIGHAYKHDVC